MGTFTQLPFRVSVPCQVRERGYACFLGRSVRYHTFVMRLDDKTPARLPGRAPRRGRVPRNSCPRTDAAYHKSTQIGILVRGAKPAREANIIFFSLIPANRAPHVSDATEAQGAPSKAPKRGKAQATGRTRKRQSILPNLHASPGKRPVSRHTSNTRQSAKLSPIPSLSRSYWHNAPRITPPEPLSRHTRYLGGGSE